MATPSERARQGCPVSAVLRDPVTIAAVLWALVGVVLLVLLDRHPDAEVRVFWSFQPPLDALVAYSAWQVAKVATGAIRRYWRVVTFAGLLLTIGDTTQTVIALTHHGQAGSAGGTVQGLCFGIGLGALIINMLLHPHPRRTRRQKFAFWLDSATVLVGGTVVAWCFAADPRDGTGVVASLVTAAAILTSGFAAVKMALSGNAPIHKAAVTPMLVAAAISIVGIFAVTDSSAGTPPYVYAIRFLPSLFLALGPRMQEIIARFDEDAFGSRRKKHYSFLPYGSIAVAFTALVVVLPDGLDARLWGVVTGVGIIFALVVGRQLASFYDNTELIRRLDVALAELRTQETRLRRQALFDGMTGLANRTHFHEQLAAALAGSGAGSVSLLLIDLDGFKAVNDSMGHAAGDALLVGVADRLTRSVRPGDLVARLGGDEFAVLLRDCGGPDAEETSHRILQALTEPVTFRDTPVRANASIGVTCAMPGKDEEALLREADLAMYAAKHEGKGTWMRYTAGMEAAPAPASTR
ncbi:diguanylate cyclase domain-containing protein [Actinoplanes sp. HUAS TT8]|uniref:diguanylate cyclase domain-containing protein n=1 Tax=Actinoplanes sp. HUAS TT8 TaxID=3447453 RepID=UPI003F51D6E4